MKSITELKEVKALQENFIEENVHNFSDKNIKGKEGVINEISHAE